MTVFLLFLFYRSVIIFSDMKRFVDYILRDVDNENETKKIAVQMRFLCLIFVLFFVVQAIVFLIFENYVTAILNLVGASIYFISFHMTYKGHTLAVRRFLTFFTLGWTVFYVIAVGWDSGVQHFLFVLIVFFAMTSYTTPHLKVAFAAICCLVRILLYFYCKYNTALLPLTRGENTILQIVNSIAVISALTCLVLLFTMDSMNMEKKLINYNKRVELLANADPLTGLPNRRSMTTRIESDIKHAEKYGGFINLAIGDIDFFKKVNDTYGHAAGDDLLKELARIFMRETEGKGDVARWGGEEFLFLLPDMNGDEAMQLLDDLRDKIKKTEFNCEGNLIHITMTFGLEEWGNGQTYDQTIERADEKLYYGKNHGRNQVVF